MVRFYTNFINTVFTQKIETYVNNKQYLVYLKMYYICERGICFKVSDFLRRSCYTYQ